jgi:hypothetical protein
MEGLRGKLIALCAAGACALVFAAPAQADFEVNNNGDGDDLALNGTCEVTNGMGDCTLRAAITEANNTSALDTITFDGITSPTLTMTITTTEPTVIDGNGPFQTAIEGNDTFRLFLVNGDPVTFRDLTLENGSAAAGGGDGGGAVRTQNDNLLFDNVTLISNHVTGMGDGSGGAVLSDDFTDPRATVTLTDSLVFLNVVESTGNNLGGGIVSRGTLNVTDTTVSNNEIISGTGANGGGLAANTGLNVLRSTISANTLASGTSFGSSGGGIYTITNLGAQTISNSTISQNTAGNGLMNGSGGGVQFSGSATVTSSTFANNQADGVGGEDIHAATPTVEQVSVKDTILADGGMAGTACGTEAMASIVSAGNNIDRGTSCGFGTADGTLENTDPLLDSLADNGGPPGPNGLPNYTHGLQPGSPAINAGSATGPATDQRGIARPQGALCDIGAFELEAGNDAPSCAGFPVVTPPVLTPAPATPATPAAPKKCKKGQKLKKGKCVKKRKKRKK